MSTIRSLIRKHGPLRVTLAITALAVPSSVGLTALIDVVLQGHVNPFDLVPALVIPGVLAPLAGYQFIRLLHQLDRAEDDLRHLASIDSLTQVYNRGHILLLAEREILRARRYVHPLSMLLLDLDLFKSVNDQYGHSVGDRFCAPRPTCSCNNFGARIGWGVMEGRSLWSSCRRPAEREPSWWRSGCVAN